MKLPEIVDAIIMAKEPSHNDILETIKLLCSEEVCKESKTLFAIEKFIKEEADYERLAP